MGLFEAFKTLVEIGKNILSGVSRVADSVVKSVSAAIGKLAEAVEKKDLPKIFEIVKTAVGEIVETAQEFAQKVTEAFSKVSEIGEFTLSDVVDAVQTVGAFVVEMFEKYPQECFSIAASIVASATFFAHGNFVMGAAQALSAIVKTQRLIEKASIQDPTVAKRYRLPEKCRQVAERFKDIPDTRLDAEFNRRGQNALL